MLQWAALGVFFRTVSWAIAIILLAKGAGKIFFWNELIGNTYTFLFSIVGYYLGGLTGIGIAYMLSYTIYTGQVYLLTSIKYNFSFTKPFIKIFLILFGTAIMCSILVNYTIEPINYFLGLILIAFSAWYSYSNLDKLIGIREIFKKITDKFHKK